MWFSGVCFVGFSLPCGFFLVSLSERFLSCVFFALLLSVTRILETYEFLDFLWLLRCVYLRLNGSPLLVSIIATSPSLLSSFELSFLYVLVCDFFMRVSNILRLVQREPDTLRYCILRVLLSC